MQVMRWSDGSYLEDQVWVYVINCLGLDEMSSLAWTAVLRMSAWLRCAHCLCVQTCRACEAWRTCLQDHWWLSGISRDVVLLAKPATHISDYGVATPLEFDADDGSLTAARCSCLIVPTFCTSLPG